MRYAAVNYTIHALMYTYYALMAFPRVRRILKGGGICVTTLQILQMIVGIAASTSVLLAVLNNRPCFVSCVSSAMALAMYASYAYLFMVLYRTSYIDKDSKRAL